MSPLLLLLALGLAQQGAAPAPSKPSDAAKSAEDQLPEEDESLRPKEYAFNPLQATKEVQGGGGAVHGGDALESADGGGISQVGRG
jgi:hypothetical protein